MKPQVSLITRRDLNVFIACLLSFALLMMPFVPVAAAASRGSERNARVSRDKSSPEQPQAVAANAPIPAPAPQPFAPVIAATKAAVLINDDGDAKADPAVSPNPEKIEYTVTITNNGTTDATNVIFNDTLDPHTTLVDGSVNTQPIADPDTYAASGNIGISKAAPGVLTNDRDPDTGNNSGLTVTKVQGVGANVGNATDTTAAGRGGVKGSVTLNSDGGFTYEPPPGFEGADSFTYEISDGFKTDTATVTINISGMAWFISNNVGGSNRGTFSNPFTTIASFNTANAGTGAIPDPKNGDTISLRTGTGTYSETDGINLRSQQKLIGNAVQFNTVFTAAADSIAAYTAFASAVAAAPTISTSGGNGVDLALDNHVRGLNVSNTPGFFKINGGAVGSPVINVINVTGTGGAMNVATSGAFAANVSFGTFESTSSPAANLNLVNVTGALGITSPGTGFSNSTAASAAINVSGGSVGFSYTGNVSKANAGALVSISGGHTGTLTFGTGTLSATLGTGLQFDNADGAYNFNGTNTLNGGDAGIDILNGSSGTFIFSAASTITSPTGASFNVASSPGTPNVTYSGSITHNTAGQRAVNVDGTTGGSISIATVTAGSLAGGVGNTGVNINNANGSVTFTTLNLGTSGNRMTAQAVTIAGGSGAKSLGTVGIFTTGAAEGIHSTTTTGAISITTGTVNAAGAAAINIAGTSAASRTPLNIDLTSLAANGGAKGLILLNTSATGSPGGFRVNGTGTTDGSGGTIQNTTTRGADIQTADSIVLKNMNFTNANSTTDGGSAGACDDLTITGCNSAIFLNGVTTLATFDNLNLTGTMVENGVTAIGVANFKFDNSVIDGPGNEVHESGIEAQNLSGTATVNNTEIRFSETDAFAVTNTDTSVNLTISGSTFRDSQTVSSGGAVNTNGEGGFQFRSFSVLAGQPSATINITTSSFLRLRTQAVQVFAQDDTIINLDITGSTLDSQADIGTGIDINSDDTATFSFNILNNPTIQSRGGAAVNITSFLDSHMEGRVNNNTDIEVLGGAGIPVRLVAQETSDMVVEINGNTVSNVNGTEDTAIDVQSRFQNARVDATITNNSVTGEPTGIAGINVISGSSTAGESNITCADVSGNNVTNAAATATRAFRVRLSDASNLNRLFLEGFVEAGVQTQDAEATWNTRTNTPTSNAATPAAEEVIASLSGTAVDPSAPPGGVCLAVDTPADFSFLMRPAKQTEQFASAPRPASGAAEVATASVASASANSTQPSMFTRALNTLSNFASGVVALVEPTAHASSEMPRSELAAASFNNKPQPAHVATQTTAGQQKVEVRATDARSRRTLSNHAKIRTPRALAAAAMVGTVGPINIGTLRPGDSVTITFQATVNNPPNLTGVPPAAPQVSNTGTVSFTEDGGTPVSTNTVNTPVDLFNTTTSLVSDLNPSNSGDLVTFTATVAESPAQATADPTGTVDFIDTSNGNAVVCDNVALTAGQAQCQVSTLTAGTHNIRADYSGDGNFDPSQSNLVEQVVIACAEDPVVTSTADDGPGSLREAIAQVCSGDTITFNIAGDGPHTITLTTGELVVARDVTIKNNSGESITVSGGGVSRVFNINSATLAAIIGLTISGGSATSGGGILNDGTLTLINSTLTGNAATTGDGGGISNPGTLTVINSTLSGNSAGGSGGGLFTSNVLNLLSSTVTNNRADSDNNSTGTGGGVHRSAGTATLHNSIVAGNFNEDGASDGNDDIAGNLDGASSSNLIGDAATSGALTNGTNGNIVGNGGSGTINIATVIDTTLASNGGTTQTHRLIPTSPAVEAGNNAAVPADTFDLDGDLVTAETVPVDQRGVGFPRNADSQDANTTQTVDIGAYELHPSIEDIANQTTAEDTPKLVVFNLGDDTGALIATVTATSSNTALVTSDGAHLSFSGSGGSRTLTITPNTNANSLADGGTTTITVTVTATNGQTAVDTFDLTVTEVNDNPVAVDDSLTAIDEDSGTRVIPFTDLTGNDSPGPANESGQTLTVTNVSNPVGGTVAINGTNVEFTPTANFFGAASFDYTVTDNGTTNGVLDAKSDTGSASFTINAINDPPSFTIAADPPASNEDGGPQTVLNFATSISAGPNEVGQILTFNISPTGSTGTLTFTSGPAIDATTGTLTYTATGDTNGTASFSVTLSDDGSNTPPNSNTSGAQSFTITVNEQNDAPVVTTTAGNLSYTENDPPTVIDGGVTVTDLDSANLASGSVAITTGFVAGQDTLAFTDQNGITGNYNSGTGVLTLTGSSSVANYQTALRSVTYQNTSDDPTASRVVTFTVNDGFSNGSATRGISITAVNDAPVNNVPGPQSTNQNTPLTFSSGNGNQVSISDVDAGTNAVQVSLTATNGTMTLSGVSGLSFSFSDANGTGAGDGTADATMTFRGTIANINAAMNGMTFTPTAGFSGAATLTITSNDLGNSGSGGPLSDTDVVNIQVATNVSIQDASVVEPKQGSVNMIFTVTLSAPAPAGGSSVSFTTVQLAPALNHATAGDDYQTTSGTVSFLAGEQFKTIEVPVLSDNKKNEANETFEVQLSNPVNLTISDGTATGTIIENDQAGAVLISELRTSGPAGAGDDFVEIYNNSDSPHVVNGTGGGYGLFKMGATCSDSPVLLGVIPNGTTIPARGHYLFTGSAYSLADYGGSGAAAGDVTMSSDIENDRNVAIFSTASLGGISSANRLDAVGFGPNVGGTCDLFREGTTLIPTVGSVLEHTYFRDECGKKGNPSTFGACPTGGLTKDSNVNRDDFIFADTTAANTPAGRRLGAPGPQNLGSPRTNFDLVAFLLDSSKSAAGTPNRVRDTTAIGPNAAEGTLSIRRRIQNNTGAPVTRLRIRVVDISTAFVTGGTADLRTLSSSDITVTVNDAATCAAAGFPSTPCTVTVVGTTLETPPAQPLGGGFNSSVTTGTITLGTPLAPGASVNLQILLGVQTTGGFKFFFNVEALP